MYLHLLYLKCVHFFKELENKWICNVVPTQLKPLPEKPGIHIQLKEPFVSMQFANMWHGDRVHSSLSVWGVHITTTKQRVRCGSGYSQILLSEWVYVRDQSYLHSCSLLGGFFFLSESVNKDVLWKCCMQMIKRWWLNQCNNWRGISPTGRMDLSAS